MSQNWLSVLIILLIIAIVIDGIRRMRKANKDSLKMSLKKHFDDENDEDVIYGSEFPNGGSRTSREQIDKERILKARSRYNFGDDLPTWNESDPKQPAERQETQEKASEAKIEPSISNTEGVLGSDEPSHIEEEVLEESAVETAAIASETLVEREVPIQTSLNLDDDVPMLMEKIDTQLTTETVSESPSETPIIDKPKERESEVVEAVEKPIQNIASKIEPSISQIDTHSANKPRYESKYTNHADQQGQIPTDVIVINLREKNGNFEGSDLLPLILENGLRFGAMDIFHFHAEEDGEGDILFSMANIVKPGTFDLAHFENFETVGLSFFLTLPVTSGSHMQAFDEMVNVTQAMAVALDGELLDENRSILTRQTIEHYRERVRDFSRREQLEKNK